MTSFKRTQRKYVQKNYRVRNWCEYEAGLRARGNLTVWLSLTDGKLANWDAPRPKRRKPGRQRKYSNHAIETTVTLGMVFGLASRQTEGFMRSLLALLGLDNDVPDHTTISRRKAKLGKVALYERRGERPIHVLIDSSGLAVHVGQSRKPPKNRSGSCLLPELQVAYDFNSENDWSAILMPEVGKSFMAGSMGITVYIKPGWAVVSPDPAERRSSVEMGIRLIP